MLKQSWVQIPITSKALEANIITSRYTNIPQIWNIYNNPINREEVQDIYEIYKIYKISTAALLHKISMRSVEVWCDVYYNVTMVNIFQRLLS